MNIKAQYYPQPSYSSVHPILIVGIGLFILPFLLPVLGVALSQTMKSILTTTAIITILIGGVMSVLNASK